MGAVTDCADCQARAGSTVVVSDHVRSTGRYWREYEAGPCDAHRDRACPWCEDLANRSTMQALCDDHLDRWKRRYEARCVECGTTWVYWGWPGQLCSDECERTRRNRKARERRALDPRACEHCGETFQPTRRDARYCSGRCRVAAHRAH